MDPTPVSVPRFLALPGRTAAGTRGPDPDAIPFETLLRGEIGSPGPAPVGLEAAGRTTGREPIPLDPKASRRPTRQTVERTELQLRAAFLREMLSPLVESLSSGLAGGGAVAGQDIYEFFVSEALSGPLAEGWPLPSVFGTDPRGAAEAGSLRQAGLPPSVLAARATSGVETRVDSGATTAAIPSAMTAAQSGVNFSAIPGAMIAAHVGGSTAAHSGAMTATVPGASSLPIEAALSAYMAGGGSAESLGAALSDALAHRLAERAVHGPGAAAAAPSAAANSGRPSGVAGAVAHSSRPSGVASPTDASVARASTAPGRRTSAGLDELVSKTAREFALPESLLHAVVQVESNGNSRAVSPKGALGLMQLMPGTAREVGVEDPFDPEQNLRGGAAYLSRQIDRFGDVPRALAAYNAGPGAVERHGGIPPYRETQNYVERVLSLVRSFEDAR